MKRLMTAVVFFAAASTVRADLTFPTTNPAGTLRPGDVVSFNVFDLTAPGVASSFIVRLDEQGRAKLPMIDEVPVGGLTNDAAGPPIAQAYQKAAILSHGVVTASIVATSTQMPVKPGPLAPGDTLRITVFELTGPGKRTDVDAAVAPDGTITLPFVGKVSVAGQSDGNASRAIAKAYKEKSVMSNPILSLLRTASGG